jgi:hypothetical protein
MFHYSQHGLVILVMKRDTHLYPTAWIAWLAFDEAIELLDHKVD